MGVEPFSLLELPIRHPYRDSRRCLAFFGRSTHQVVNGEEIARQIRLGTCSLVITNYDYYDGASTWFYLLNSTGVIIDSASTPDYFGFIQDIVVREPATIHFGFFGTDDRWELTAREEGFWSFAPAQLARRINRFFFRKRFMSLNRIMKSSTGALVGDNPADHIAR